MYKLQNCHIAFKRGYSRDKTNGGPSADARADRRLLLIVSTDLQSSITGTRQASAAGAQTSLVSASASGVWAAALRVRWLCVKRAFLSIVLSFLGIMLSRKAGCDVSAANLR